LFEDVAFNSTADADLLGVVTRIVVCCNGSNKGCQNDDGELHIWIMGFLVFDWLI
jgi:hypothetical protein